MSHILAGKARSGQRRGPYRRWSASDKARYLAAFERSRLSSTAFCDEMNIPPSTFALWQRAARQMPGAEQAAPAASRVAFARVEGIAGLGGAAWSDEGRRLRVLVRGVAGGEVALEGVDGATAVRVVELVLAWGSAR